MDKRMVRDRCAVWIGSFLRSSVFYLLFSTLLLPSGCASAVAVGTNTALNGVDLVTMTDQMSTSILGDPAVRAAIAEKTSLKGGGGTGGESNAGRDPDRR